MLICDWSLRLVGAWLVMSGLADISDVAILRRLRHSQRWLGQLIVALLCGRQVCGRPARCGTYGLSMPPKSTTAPARPLVRACVLRPRSDVSGGRGPHGCAQWWKPVRFRASRRDPPG